MNWRMPKLSGPNEGVQPIVVTERSLPGFAWRYSSVGVSALMLKAWMSFCIISPNAS